MASTDEDAYAYRDVFEASPDPIFVHHPETGEVLEANPAAAALLGVQRKTVIGMDVGDFSPPEYTTAEANDLIREAAREGSNRVEWAVHGPDGDPHWVDVAMEHTTVGDDPRVVAYVRDVTEYRRAEQEHRTERNLLDRLLDVSPVGIVIHDADGTIQRTNEEAEEILGVDRAELVGETSVPDQFRPLTVDGDPLARADVPAEAVIEADEPVQDRELRIERADGTQVVVSASATPLYDAEEALQHVVVSITDITERRERERERSERNEHLRTLIDNLPVVVFTLGPDGVFTHSAGKGLETLGLEPGELMGTSVFDVYAEYPDIVAAAERALDGEEIRVTQELGDLSFETWYRPVFDESGDLTQVVGVARDVTDIKRQQANLRRLSDATQELLYAESASEAAETVTTIARQIIDRPIAAMWIYDESDDTLYPVGATGEATEVAGVAAATELPPMTPGTREKAIFDSGETTHIEDYQQLDSPSAPDVPLRSLICLPLEEYGLLCIGSPEIEEFDEMERVLLEILAGAATAALDRAEHQQELRAYRTELERSNESLQQFAYIASHDLQEPLRMVSSFLDLLETEYADELDGEATEYIDYAVDGADRMRSMINALLDYSRVHTQAGEPEPVDSEQLLADTISDLQMLLTETDATVDYDDLPVVEADADQARQLFQNLLKNAVEHSATETPPHVAVSAHTLDDMVRFEVADDGPGIDPKRQDKVFEIFQSGDREGTGIGLAVCERIVARHNGNIWVESTPGEGATFCFTLPAESPGGAYE